jgi:cytochrome P450
LAVYEVAREFEFTTLRQRVFSFRDSLITCAKNGTRANLRSRRAGLLLHRIIGSMIAERRHDHRDRGDLLSLLLAARDHR